MTRASLVDELGGPWVHHEAGLQLSVQLPIYISVDQYFASSGLPPLFPFAVLSPVLLPRTSPCAIWAMHVTRTKVQYSHEFE